MLILITYLRLIIITFSNKLIEGMFVELGYYPNITGELCGIRYKTIRMRINFVVKCFANEVQNQTIDYMISPFDFKGEKPVESRLYEGYDSVYGEFPWAALLIFDQKWGGISSICTGSIVNKRWVITAAHCNYAEGYVRKRVFVGNTQQLLRGQTIRVSDRNIFRHPSYSGGSANQFDIALYKLDNDIDMGNDRGIEYTTNTVCLPTSASNRVNDEREEATTFGWGMIWSGIDANGHTRYNYTDRLQRGELFLEPYHSVCAKELVNMLCAKHDVNKGLETRPCGGDSGGGVLQYIDYRRDRAVLVGVLSGTARTDPNKHLPLCDQQIVSTYQTSVAQHIDWIIQTIEQN